MSGTSPRSEYEAVRSPSRSSLLAVVVGLALSIAWPANADWLVTQYGDEIETRGPWRVEDGWVYFTDTDDREDLLPLEDIDLEASERVTAAEVPEITLFMTSWCGYCRLARELLEDLDARFDEKDIEIDEDARRQFHEVADGRRTVPVLKAGDIVIRGFSEEAIRKLVERQKAWDSR